MLFASHSTRMAIAASPAPRNTALIRNSSRITTFPPSMIRAYVLPIVSGARAHEGEETRREGHADRPGHHGHDHAQRDPLHRRLGRPLEILLADTPRHHGRDADREPHGGGVNEGEERLR